MRKKFTSKSVAQKFELKWNGPLSKLCVTPPFCINFRCQIKNQVSDYRLLGASSLCSPIMCLYVTLNYNFCLITMLGWSLPPFDCRRAHVLFTLFVFVCILWCPMLIVLCFCFVFLRFVYHNMLPVSLDCPFLIAPSVFSNINLVFFFF
jgi:hypothetical protein